MAPNTHTARIAELRAAFAGIERVNPDRLPEFRAILADLDDADLLMMAGANVKFVSKLAVNACVRRGIWVQS